MVLSRRATRRCLTATALLASGAVIAGCGGSSSNGSTGNSAQTEAAAKSISLSRAAYLSTNAPGYKIKMLMQVNAAGSSVNLSASGAFDIRAHEGSMQMDMSLAGQSVPIRMVLAHDTIYEKLPARITSRIPGGKPWISIDLRQMSTLTKIPGFSSLMSSSSSLQDPGQYMDYLKAAAGGSLRNVGQSTVEGVATTHYTFRLDLARLPRVVPAAARQGISQMLGALKKRFDVSYGPMNVWIDQSGLVRKVRITVHENVQGRAVTTRVTELMSDYGSQPSPSVPTASETTNVMSLIHSGG